MRDGNNLSKLHFGYFCCSLAYFKNLIILFGTYGLFMICEKVEEVLL